MGITESIRQSAISLGANLVGGADVSCLPAEVTEGLMRAVSIAVALDPAVIRKIERGPTVEYFVEYRRVNALLDRVAGQIADTLRDAGHRAQTFQATTENIDPATLAAQFQHRTAATRAGLGWIGKSGLLVTKEYGAAVRLASVLTDASLEAGLPVETSSCGDCRLCVEHCPAGAVVGANWQAGLARDHIYDPSACLKMARSFAERNRIKATICGICINICPWTQRYLARRRMPPGLDIVPAMMEDLQTVRGLFREYEATLPFDLSFQNFEEELKTLPGRYAAPNGRILLARHGDTLAGCAALRQIGEGVCEMKRLFIRPESRGRGIGRVLAQAIIEEARRIGYKRMRLDTVLEPARSLYRSLGFREIPPYQHVPIEGVVFMELEL